MGSALCGNPLCRRSTGICGQITAGTGKLDFNGYFENPCHICAEYCRALENLRDAEARAEELSAVLGSIGKHVGAVEQPPEQIERLVAEAFCSLRTRAAREARQDRACAEKAERRLGEALAITSPWPLWDILQRLVEAADHLYREHNCDRHGYEGVMAARDAGRRLVDVLRSAEGGGETRIAEVRREALEEAERTAREIASKHYGNWEMGDLYPPTEHSASCAAEEVADAIRALATQAPAGEPTCTGITAAWCPIHGDCTCRDAGEYARADVDQGCPLHGDSSTHVPAGEPLSPSDRDLLADLANYVRSQGCDGECVAVIDEPCLICRADEYDRTRGHNAPADEE